MRDIVQLLRERIEQGLFTIFIKIKAYRGDPLNELADRWADEGRQSEYLLVPPNEQTLLLLDGQRHNAPQPYEPKGQKKNRPPGITATTQDPHGINSKFLDQERQLRRPPWQIP